MRDSTNCMFGASMITSDSEDSPSPVMRERREQVAPILHVSEFERLNLIQGPVRLIWYYLVLALLQPTDFIVRAVQ